MAQHGSAPTALCRRARRSRGSSSRRSALRPARTNRKYQGASE